MIVAGGGCLERDSRDGRGLSGLFRTGTVRRGLLWIYFRDGRDAAGTGALVRLSEL